MRRSDMLYQELPRIEYSPLDRWGRWLVPAVIGAAAITAAVVMLLLAAQPWLAIAALALGVIGATVSLRRSGASTIGAIAPALGGTDYSLVGSALEVSADPVALTNGDGAALVVNGAYRERFGSVAPSQLAVTDAAREGVKLAQSMAWRDGAGCVAGIETDSGIFPVEVDRVGTSKDLLLWRFPKPPHPDPLSIAVRRMEGAIGERLGAAGVATAVVDAKGAIVGANR